MLSFSCARGQTAKLTATYLSLNLVRVPLRWIDLALNRRAQDQNAYVGI